MENYSTLLFSIICALAIYRVSSQNDCPTGWKFALNNCWYFSKQIGSVDRQDTWAGAESFCQANGGHLAKFETTDESDYVYSTIQVFQDTDWWIGLTDTGSEGTYRWIDGTTVDPDVEHWKFGEPSNTGGEDCVEMWINLPLYRGDWNDKSCDAKDYFICKREPGVIPSCEDGWSDRNGACYRVFTNELQWPEADAYCKAAGADLTAITTSAEQQIVKDLVYPLAQNVWIGLSDTDTPGTMQWSSHEAVSYDSFGTGQSANNPPYTGSSCAVVDPSLGYNWNAVKCSDEHGFVCEKSYKATCPTAWTYLAGKCYEFVVNPNRATSWTTAKEECQSLGGGLLKIESDDQQQYLGTVLEQYYNSGAQEIWIGGSDVGHDDEFLWWDNTAITLNYWDINMPNKVSGQYDCMAMYSGTNKHSNWETTSCFQELQYICERPEGSKLPEVPVISVDGKCNDGWRWFREYCYYFGSAEQSESAAENYCHSLAKDGNTPELATLLDVDEISFVHGHIQQDSWIGLKKVGSTYQWVDGSALTVPNWDASASQTQGCVYMRESDGRWIDDSCSQLHTFACKTPQIQIVPYTPTPPGLDPDYEKCGGNGWISDPKSDRCYKFDVSRTRTWNDARFNCQQYGGDLASINSPDENDFIAFLAQDLGAAANLWIGASDKQSYQDDVLDVIDGGWGWSDGSPFNYVNWNNGEPNNVDGEDCAEMMLSDGMWNDLDCAALVHFACEKKGNVDNIIGTDVSQTECRSNEACCFKHLGVEKGGVIPDSALSASSVRNQNYNETRGRLNTQETVIITDIGDTRIGYHGGWEPDEADQDQSWFQVDFQVHNEIKGIITQGRNGYELNNERQWVKTFKISYSQDPDHVKKDVENWEFLSDDDGNHIIFQGNRDQDTQVTNLFPRPIIAKHIRCHPQTYYDRVAMRLEYIGCRASCLNRIGMNNGYIADSGLSSSSGDAKQARPPVDKTECLDDESDNGADYRGWLSKTQNGIDCQPWSSQSPHSHDRTPQNYPDSGLIGDYCRNPDGEPRPWCYTMDPDTRWDFCSVPDCPDYVATGWTPSSSNTNQYVQVHFDDYYKVSGITLYATSGYFVKSYKVKFSNDGYTFRTYLNQNGDDHVFVGNEKANTEYTDILREPITAKYLRIQPQSWNSRITMQFEVNGCYADRVITCADKGTIFDEDEFTIACPGGCVEDPSKGTVWGTSTYTEASAICPAAIHAGKLTNDHGGSVSITKINGRSSYEGSYRNGITSLDFTTAAQSLIFNGQAYRCPDNWIGWNEHCYHFSASGIAKSWTEARSDCVAMGGDLASITSSAENDFIMTVVVQAFNGRVLWIGMNALDIENYYQWSDGTTVTYTKWYLHEPNSKNEKCVNMYRINGYWNDRVCEEEHAYMCKRPKEHLPPVTTISPPTDEGCDVGWRANGYSCYYTSPEAMNYYYAKQICEEMESHMVTIHDFYEQAFVHAQVTSSLPPSLGYTSWIGLTAKSDEKGAQIYVWESGEPVTYTLWDEFQPDVDLKCSFPFVYKGQTYYECTTADNPVTLKDQPWCSVTPVFSGVFLYCGNGNAQGCAYMDDRTGYWNMDLCTTLRHYTCEKPRVGYTQPSITTREPVLANCEDGWETSEDLVSCYQINEFSDLSDRVTWQMAYDYCTAQNGDLVSIHSSQEEVALAKMIQAKGINSGSPFWIGLNSITNTAGYSWSDGSGVSYTNWAPNEPSDHNGRENCVESLMTEYSQWNDLNCDAFRNWICKIGKNRRPNPPPTLPTPGGVADGGCGEGWIKYTTAYGSVKCYMFVTDRQEAWSVAETNCQGKGGDLVSIHDQDENTLVLSRAAEANGGAMWIGLRDIGGRSFYWADGTNVDYVNWGPGEPNDYLDNEDCGDISSSQGLWNDDNCGLRKNYICEKCLDCQDVEIPPTNPPTGGCPEGFSLYGNKCYYSSMDLLLRFDVAMEYCRNMSSELAVINNEYEQAFLASYLWGISENVWIGFYHRGTGSFVWVDQSPVTYIAWDGGQPDNYNDREGCTEMWLGPLSTGRWNDAYCDDEKSFACYVRRSEDNSGNPPADSGECPSGFTQWKRGCYMLVTNAMSRDDARSYCVDQGSDLPNIDQVYENEWFHSMFWKGDLTQSDNIWIGLTYSVTISDSETKNTSFAWSNGWPVEYTNWGQDQPATVDTTGGGCVYLDSSGYWSATNGAGAVTPSTALPFVCKITLEPIPTEPPIREGVCDPSFKEFNNFCYYLNPGITEETSRSWFEAKAECEDRGADLASFHSDEELNYFIQSITGVQSHNLFIGLYSNGYDGWVWSDGSGVEYLNWNDNEPNGQGNGEECVEMYPWNGAWNDVSCYEDRGYVCKKPAGHTRCNVPAIARVECGEPGISETLCVTHRGCCFDPTAITANFSGCFFDEASINRTEEPPEKTGLSGGAIAGIVIGVLLAVILIVGGVFYCKSGSAKSMPSMPSFSAPSFMKKPSPPSGGFDNPMTLPDTSDA